MRLESLPGSVLDQKYRIEKQLGEGAMGAVFQATHLGTTRPVAIKVIVPQLAGNQEFGQRFKREAEAAGRLSHPNVVNVTDFGVTQVENRDLAYLVMEFLDGESLADYLAKNPRPTFNFLLDVMDQAGLALDAAHAAGIVHRDLKPSNIWLEPNHRGGFNVKVLDFGIAKVTDSAVAVKERATKAEAVETMFMAPEEAASLSFSDSWSPLGTPSNLRTTAGSVLGTPAYMAPEQCASIEVNPPADVYSLAVIAYQMLCGQLPFQADRLPELIRLQIQTTPKSPREHDRTVPEGLATVVLSGLDKDPARRPPTAGTFAARLRAASEGELDLLRKSKDVFHTHPIPFMPVMLACLAVMVVAMIPIQQALVWAARNKLASEGILFATGAVGFVLFTLFAFQLFKAAGMLMLIHASEQGTFRGVGGFALRRLANGFGALLRTQLLSTIDLRPTSWRDNVLWPVVWAAEGRAGKEAIDRSRELCRTLPGAALSVTLRQYGPALLGMLAFPFAVSLFDSSGAAMHVIIKEVLSGSSFGAFFLYFYPMIFGVMFVNFAQAFSFLYWATLRCRNEGSAIALPAALRDDRRKASGRTMRPASLMWIGMPLAMLLLILVRLNGSKATQALDDAANDGRHTAMLRLIDGGLPVDEMSSDHETALFEAVRSGDEKLVAELLKRGANVNSASRSGMTPLLVGAAWSRNDLARMLLDRGASVDASNRSGRTSLMLAAMRGNEGLVKLLLERGANPAGTDSHGKTAAAYASEEGYADLAARLSKSGK